MSAREPRRHSRLYTQTTHRLVHGDPELAKAIKGVEDIMTDLRLKTCDLRRIVSYLEEKYRWVRYNVAQTGTVEEITDDAEVEDIESIDDDGEDFI